MSYAFCTFYCHPTSIDHSNSFVCLFDANEYRTNTKLYVYEKPAVSMINTGKLYSIDESNEDKGFILCAFLFGIIIPIIKIQYMKWYKWMAKWIIHTA